MDVRHGPNMVIVGKCSLFLETKSEPDFSGYLEYIKKIQITSANSTVRETASFQLVSVKKRN